VLFEDLRIESSAARQSQLVPWLDTIGKEYRYFYFLRRMVLTLFEFRGGLHQINKNATWKTLQLRFDRETLNEWNQAVRHLDVLGTEIELMRHHTGGHFLYKAAERALNELHPETEGLLTVVVDEEQRHAGVRLHYATELVDCTNHS
jgi:hypothetical protein